MTKPSQPVLAAPTGCRVWHQVRFAMLSEHPEVRFASPNRTSGCSLYSTRGVLCQPRTGGKEVNPPSRVAWLSLDAGDNDPARFWMYVLTALRAHAPEILSGMNDQFESAAADAGDAALTALVNALAGLSREIVLVLDDYHLIETPGIHPQKCKPFCARPRFSIACARPCATR